MTTTARLLFAGLSLTAGVLHAAESPITLMIPRKDATVSVLTEGQRAFFALDDDARRKVQGVPIHGRGDRASAQSVAHGWVLPYQLSKSYGYDTI